MERVELALLPTPVQLLPRLSEELGVEVHAKRDDLTGFGLSGNKVRKLEYLLADALEQGADTVITCGGLQSNHCRATAVAARRLGLQPVLLLRGTRPATPDGNLLIDQLLGARVHLCSADDYRRRRGELMEAIAARVRGDGGTPYVIPEGGSNALGSRGFVRAAAELRSAWDTIVVPVGSGGTLAGLVLGRPSAEIVGVAVCDDAATFRDIVLGIADEASILPPSYGDGWRVTDSYRGPGYGVAPAEVWKTIGWVAQLEGLILDPTYTGKAMHGLRGEARAGRLGERVLFWHTGGAFGLFGRGAEVEAASG